MHFAAEKYMDPEPQRRRLRMTSWKSFAARLQYGSSSDAIGSYLAFLWISTVLHVLSAAWQIFSSGHSAHFGLRATHSLRPCQITSCEKSVQRSRGMIFIRSCSMFLG